MQVQGINNKVDTLYKMQQHRLEATEEELFKSWKGHRVAVATAIQALTRRRKLDLVAQVFQTLK